MSDSTQRVLWNNRWVTFHANKGSPLRGFVYQFRSRVYGSIERRGIAQDYRFTSSGNDARRAEAQRLEDKCRK